MAEKLNVLKARIKAITGTHKITKTMDMISRSRTAKILSIEQGMRPYTQKLNRIIEELSHTDLDNLHPLLKKKKNIKNITLFVITSTRGLCGSYNTKILDEAMERIRHIIDMAEKLNCMFWVKKARLILKNKKFQSLENIRV